MTEQENPDGEELAAKLIESGVAGVFNDPEFRNACVTEIKEALGPLPGAKLIARAIYSILQTGLSSALGLLSAAAKSRLHTVINRIPVVGHVSRKLIRIADKCNDRAKLKNLLIEGLKHNPILPDEELGSRSIDELHVLLTQQTLDSLDEVTQQTLEVLREAYDEILRQRDRQYRVRLDNKLASRSAARRQIESGAKLPSLAYSAEVDVFRGRADMLDLLQHFVGDLSLATARNRFSWLLLLGDGGEGKSRLALQFARHMADRGWWAGFLPRSELGRLDTDRWVPIEPTFLVVDYPAEAAGSLRDLILAFAGRAEQEFDYPVRILFLERQAAGRWFDSLMLEDSDRPLLEVSRWRDPVALPPLSRDELVGLMVHRFNGLAPDQQALWQALCVVDNRVDAENRPSPRPLFAAATALLMAESGATEVTREAVLERLVQRDRIHFWHVEAANDEACIAHENLLAVATCALGIERAAFDERSALLPAASWLPRPSLGNPPRIDDGHYRRMSGVPATHWLAPLQPDLLGEYFALSHLANQSEIVRRALVDSAYEFAQGRFAPFLARCLRDFPRLVGQLDDLRPSPESDASFLVDFTQGLVQASYDQGHGLESHVIDRVLSRIITEDRPDLPPEARGNLAIAMGNLTRALAKSGRGREAKDLADALDARFRTSEHPVVKAAIVNALAAKALSLAEDGDIDAEFSLYDEILRRYEDCREPQVELQVASVLANKTDRLGKLQRIQDRIQTFDALISRYGSSKDPFLFNLVAGAMFSRGAAFADVGRLEDTIKAHSETLDRLGESQDPAIRTTIARTLYTRAVAFVLQGRTEEARQDYVRLSDLVEESDPPAMQEMLAMCLVSHLYTYLREEDWPGAVAAMEAVLPRFDNSADEVVGEYVARAMAGQACAAAQFQPWPEANQMFDAVVERFGGVAADNVQKMVIEALFAKAECLNGLSRWQDAYDAFGAVMERISLSCPEGDRTLQRTRALVGQVAALGDLNRDQEALRLAESLTRELSGSERPELQALQAEVDSYRLRLEVRIHRPNDPSPLLDTFVARHGESEIPSVQDYVVSALADKVRLLEQDSRFEEALPIYDRIAEIAHNRGTSELLETHILALGHKANALVELDRPTEACLVFDEIYRHFGKTAGSEALVRSALFEKAQLYQRLQRLEDALATLEILISEFRDSAPPNPEVAGGLLMKGLMLKDRGDLAEAHAVFMEAASLAQGQNDADGRYILAAALLNCALCRDGLGFPVETRAALQLIVDHYADSDDTRIRHIYSTAQSAIAQLDAAFPPEVPPRA